MINMNALINKYAEADTGGVTAFIVYKYKEMRQQIEEIMEDDDLWEMQRKIRDIVEDLNATPNPHVGVITYNVQMDCLEWTNANVEALENIIADLHDMETHRRISQCARDGKYKIIKEDVCGEKIAYTIEMKNERIWQ